MMKAIVTISMALCVISHASDDIPLLQPEERREVEQQTDAFNAALQPSLTEAAKSTVRVWFGKNRIAYGTVVGDGTRVLTKWSEVATARDNLLIEGTNKETRGAKVIGVYENEDLALLEVAGRPLPPVKWSRAELPLGSFVASPQPDGRPAAFGVVSVLARNLKETDQAFLGVLGEMDYRGQGTKVAQITKGSAAEDAGLQVGDVILKIGDRPISGVLELRNALTASQPGETVRLVFQRGKEEHEVAVVLGNRQESPQFSGARIAAMERMGTELSRVRTAFPSAIQSDMRPQPDQIGGPVVDLDGNVVGITLARADRTRSFFMPASSVEAMLARPWKDPSVATVATVAEPGRVARAERRPRSERPQPPGESPRQSQERMRQHFTEMQRLMEFMEREMEMLNEEK
jgi:S1-C subfamily serine protease